MRKLIRNKIFISLFIIIFIILGLIFWIFGYKTGNFNARLNILDIQKIEEELSKEKTDEVKNSDYYPIENIYDILHRMSNTKIIAEDNEIWGELPMDPEYIESLKNFIENVNYEDKEYMLEVLNRWQDNDFSQAVEEHNYFWRKLGGTVGRASGLK